MKRSIPIIIAGLLLVIVMIVSSTPKTGDPALTVSEMFVEGLVTFGFAANSHIFCDPLVPLPNPMPIPSPLDSLWKLANPVRDKFASLPDDAIPDSDRRQLGDTLNLVWSESSGRLAVEAIGFYESECHRQFAYRLMPVDSISPFPTWRETFLLLRNTVKLSAPIVPYRKYEVTDSSLLEFENSLRVLVAQTHEKEIKTSLDDITVEYYGVITKKALPDTLFITVHGHWSGATEWCWHTLYVAVQSDSVWEYSELIKLHKGNFRFQIDSAFDLNGDGIMEMLVMESASGAVYSFVNGQLLLVASSPYRGC